MFPAARQCHHQPLLTLPVTSLHFIYYLLTTLLCHVCHVIGCVPHAGSICDAALWELYQGTQIQDQTRTSLLGKSLNSTNECVKSTLHELTSLVFSACCGCCSAGRRSQSVAARAGAGASLGLRAGSRAGAGSSGSLTLITGASHNITLHSHSLSQHMPPSPSHSVKRHHLLTVLRRLSLSHLVTQRKFIQDIFLYSPSINEAKTFEEDIFRELSLYFITVTTIPWFSLEVLL